MEEIRVDMREMNEKDMALYAKHEELLFKLNQTMPRTAEYMDILRELFDGRIGEDSFVREARRSTKLFSAKGCLSTTIFSRWHAAE